MEWLSDKRMEADWLRKISIFKLKRWGCFGYYHYPTTISWGEGESQSRIRIEVNLLENLRNYLSGEELARNGYVRIMYESEGQDYDYQVKLSSTICHFGGFRLWFLCPSCGRRVGVLYQRSALFACRECNYLTYEIRNDSHTERLLGRIISIREAEEAEKDVKRMYYNGRPTRKFLRFVRVAKRFREVYSYQIGKLSDQYEKHQTSIKKYLSNGSK